MRSSACLAVAAVCFLVGCSSDPDDLFSNSGGAGQGGAPSTSSQTGTAVTSTSASTSTTTGSMVTTTTTGGPMCGNGMIEGGEQCDGNNLGGNDCTSMGFVNPAGVTCVACTLDFGGCKGVCGNGVSEPDEECDDGNPVAGDGCAACLLEGGSCLAPIPVSLGPGTTVLSGATIGGSDNFQPQQTNSCQDGTGPDLVYEIVASQNGFMTAWIAGATADYDAVMYIRTECDQAPSQLLCDDNFGTASGFGGEAFSLPVVAGTPYFLVVDGFLGDQGSFDLVLDLHEGDDCSDPVPIYVEGQSNIVALGSTTGFANEVQCVTGAGLGPDVVYAITVDASDNYGFYASAGYNSVLNARTSCEDLVNQIGCANPSGNDSQLSLMLADDSTTYLWVDGTMGQMGTYALIISH